MVILNFLSIKINFHLKNKIIICAFNKINQEEYMLIKDNLLMI
jgi:hypothetical protein